MKKNIVGLKLIINKLSFSSVPIVLSLDQLSHSLFFVVYNSFSYNLIQFRSCPVQLQLFPKLDKIKKLENERNLENKPLCVSMSKHQINVKHPPPPPPPQKISGMRTQNYSKIRKNKRNLDRINILYSGKRTSFLPSHKTTQSLGALSLVKHLWKSFLFIVGI